MGSALETQADDSAELSPAQIKTLIKAGISESDIRANYEKLRQKYSSGTLTEEEFVAKFCEPEVDGKKNMMVYSAKQLFALTDRNKSGTVSLYEYLLTLALVANQDPSSTIKFLFKVFDSDQDGLLNQAEVVDVLKTYLQMSADNEDNTDQETSDASLDEIKSSVAEGFGDKTQVSEREFREVCEKSTEIQALATRLHTVFMLGMMFDDSDF